MSRRPSMIERIKTLLQRRLTGQPCFKAMFGERYLRTETSQEVNAELSKYTFMKL